MKMVVNFSRTQSHTHAHSLLLFNLSIFTDVSDGSIVFSIVAYSIVFLSLRSSNEPLHLARWNVAWTCCTLTTSGSLLNVRVKGQGHMGSLCVSCVRDTAWTSWPEFRKCCTAIGCGQYLALSNGWRSCFYLRVIDIAWCCVSMQTGVPSFLSQMQVACAGYADYQRTLSSSSPSSSSSS